VLLDELNVQVEGEGARIGGVNLLTDDWQLVALMEVRHGSSEYDRVEVVRLFEGKRALDGRISGCDAAGLVAVEWLQWRQQLNDDPPRRRLVAADVHDERQYFADVVVARRRQKTPNVGHVDEGDVIARK